MRLYQAHPGGSLSPASLKTALLLTDDGTDGPGPQGREQWVPGSNPWLLDLRSSFSHSKNMNGPPSSCRPGSPNPGQIPLGYSRLPAGCLRSSIPRKGRRLSCRERDGPGIAFECLFLHTQATLRSHSGSVLPYRKQQHFLQLCPLEGPAVNSQSPATLRDALALRQPPPPGLAQRGARLEIRLMTQPEGGPDQGFARATPEHQADGGSPPSDPPPPPTWAPAH